jgi:hypothetical protein
MGLVHLEDLMGEVDWCTIFSCRTLVSKAMISHVKFDSDHINRDHLNRLRKCTTLFTHLSTFSHESQSASRSSTSGSHASSGG